MNNLYRHSIDVILQNQSSGGAYIASPVFQNYHYCWLRDGSFIAHAMDRVGQSQSAEMFFRWAGATIQRYASKVDEIEKKRKAGITLSASDILHTRFTLEGFEEDPESAWGNFQIDGYGTWLWALAQHVQLTHDFSLLHDVSDALSTTLRYLALIWDLPNYDCWEEHPEYLHPYSLATVFGGFQAAAFLKKEGLLKDLPIDAGAYAERIRQFIIDHAISNGKFAKHIWPAIGSNPAKPVTGGAVDASLLGMVFPFNVFDALDPVMTATLGDIEANLHREGGGVYRYKKDVYYGGGEWILLTAWLGLHNLRIGKKDQAVELIKWIEDQADPQDNLPEQVSSHLLAPDHYEPWLKNWGPVASPLLWSHAMYLILYQELQAELDRVPSR